MQPINLNQLPQPPLGKKGWPWTDEINQLHVRMCNGKPWPKVSIVTPSLNQAQFLEETIRSILLQGYPNLEYFVIDGGSTDGSVEIIQKYNEWLTYWVSEPDKGQADAINKGWRKARGEIISWLNSDDSYCRDTMQNVVSYFLKNPDADFLYGDCNCIDENDVELGIMKAWKFDLRRQFTGRNLIYQSSTFFRKCCLELVGELDTGLNYVMDYDLWIRMLLAGCNIHRLSKTLSNYRIHKESKTVATQLPMRQEVLLLINKIYGTNSTSNRHQKWKGRAYSNYHRSIGDVFYSIKNFKKARTEYMKSIRFHPTRFTTVIVFMYIIDTFLGTNLGQKFQKFRWRLPDAPKNDLYIDEIVLNTKKNP